MLCLCVVVPRLRVCGCGTGECTTTDHASVHSIVNIGVKSEKRREHTEKGKKRLRNALFVDESGTKGLAASILAYNEARRSLFCFSLHLSTSFLQKFVVHARTCMPLRKRKDSLALVSERVLQRTSAGGPLPGPKAALLCPLLIDASPIQRR